MQLITVFLKTLKSDWKDGEGAVCEFANDSYVLKWNES